MNIRRVHPAGVAGFELAPDFQPPDRLRDMVERAMLQAAQGTAWIVGDHRGPLFLGGIAVTKPGVGELWTMPGCQLPHASLAAIRFFRDLSRDFLKQVVQAMNLRRLHAFVRADSPRDIRFAEWAGFVFEGSLLRLGPEGETLNVMRWEMQK